MGKIHQKMQEKVASMQEIAFHEVGEVGAGLVGEENASMAREGFEMAQKIKEGKVSAKDMRKFMIKQAQDNPEKTKAMLDSLGFSSMKAEMDAVEGQLKEGMEDAQAHVEDVFEDV